MRTVSQFPSVQDYINAIPSRTKQQLRKDLEEIGDSANPFSIIMRQAIAASMAKRKPRGRHARKVKTTG